MFDKILVPVDGSAAAYNAMEHVLHSFSSEKTQVTALCVIDVRVSTQGAEVYLPKWSELSVSDYIVPPTKSLRLYQDWAQEVVEWAKRRGKAENMDVHSEVVSGIPYEEVISHSKHYDLLAMGISKPFSSYPGPFFAGCTAWYVASRTYLPLLCVFEPPKQLNTVLVIFDGTSESQDALQLASTMCRLLQLELIILATDHNGRLAAESLHKLPEHMQTAAPSIMVMEGEPKEFTFNFAAQHNCDLLILGTKTPRWPFGHSLGKLADSLLRTGSIPVMLCH
jgi:nucleotide-binding universal stress UspA family protein